MSTITSSFVPTEENDTFVSKNSLTSSQIKDTNLKLTKEIESVRTENRNLSEELDKSRQRCIDLQLRLDAAAVDSTVVDEMIVKLEERQATIDNLEQRLASVSSNHQVFMNNVREALSLTDDTAEVSAFFQFASYSLQACYDR